MSVAKFNENDSQFYISDAAGLRLRAARLRSIKKPHAYNRPSSCF
jgi:hypothetical protein